MLFQVRGNAEILDSIATSLPQILGCSSPLGRHTLNLQRRKLNWIELSLVTLV